MKQAIRAVSLLLVLGVILTLAACGGTADSTDATTDGEAGGTASYGGNIVTYFAEFYNEYDPAVYTNRNFVSFYYDMLWNIDLGLDQDVFNYTSTYLSADYLTGQIADSWEVAPDFTSMTVKLRKDVKFQDKTAVGMDATYNVYGARTLVAADVL
jgi:ABC-type transport system substrate-binding protein